MSAPEAISFTRYLAAKRTVDDRALNRGVWDALLAALPARRPLRVLELGAGIGTMIQRSWEWGLLPERTVYTALDAAAENIGEARRRLAAWAEMAGIHAGAAPGGGLALADSRRAEIHFETADALEFAGRAHPEPWDLLLAHAFLDLVDIPAILPALFGLLHPGGLFYFTLTFDGVTSFEPAFDAALDAQIEALYHRTMDERRVAGRPSGDSRSGRHLLAHLQAAGAQILAAGSSDWVVVPVRGGYPADEAAFLHFIVNTVEGALTGHPALDAGRLPEWAAARRAQIERGELIYIAHQLDVLGAPPRSE